MSEDRVGGTPGESGSLGPHRYRIEHTRLYLESHGQLQGEHGKKLRELALELIRQHGLASMLLNLRNSAGPTPEARREMSQLFQATRQPLRIAILGAPSAIRLVALLMQTAIRIRYGTELTLRFFDNELAAESWLCEGEVRSS